MDSSASKQIQTFIAHAPDFSKDLDLPDIDDKHQAVVAAAYAQLEKSETSLADNFRSWGGQSDLSVPAQMSIANIRANGPALALAKYAYRKVLRRDSDRVLKDSILDDIAIIEQIGGKRFLDENPVHETLGVKEFYFVGNRSVSTRWLRYLYLLQRIESLKMIPKGGIWVDVGSYYGGLQGLVRKYRPDVKMVLVDFHHQLCRSYIYLHSQSPDANHILPDAIEDGIDLAAVAKGSILYLPATQFSKIGNQNVDLITNFFSLGEMRRSVFNSYTQSPAFQKAKTVFLVNRFVSAPFFEKTYDSDISVRDYEEPSRSVTYFDVFPMHHYLSLKRYLFGRKRLRNTSSPYFEMITKQK